MCGVKKPEYGWAMPYSNFLTWMWCATVTIFSVWLKNENHSKNEDNLKRYPNFENEDNLKEEGYLKMAPRGQ